MKGDSSQERPGVERGDATESRRQKRLPSERWKSAADAIADESSPPAHMNHDRRVRAKAPLDGAKEEPPELFKIVLARAARWPVRERRTKVAAMLDAFRCRDGHVAGRAS